MNSNIHKAGFVPLEEIPSERFKYFKSTSIIKFVNKKKLSLQRKVNSRFQSLQLTAKNVKWKLLRNEFAVWFTEAAIEGLAWNFALSVLFGLQFNVLTVIAYGVLTKQILSTYWRLKKDGSNSKIPTKD